MADETGDHDISVDYNNIVIQPGTNDDIHNDGFLYKNATNGAVLNVTGALPKIEQGQTGLVESATIEQLLEQKKITLTANIGGVSTPITEVEDLKKYYFNQPSTTPSQDKEIPIIDPALETPAAMQVYNTDELVRYLTETPLDGITLNTYDSTLSKIYNNFGIAQASDGSTANLNIGNDQKMPAMQKTPSNSLPKIAPCLKPAVQAARLTGFPITTSLLAPPPSSRTKPLTVLRQWTSSAKY